MGTFSSATEGTRRWATTSSAALGRTLRRLARRRRLQLVSFLIVGVLLGGGLVAAFDFGSNAFQRDDRVSNGSVNTSDHDQDQDGQSQQGRGRHGDH